MSRDPSEVVLPRITLLAGVPTALFLLLVVLVLTFGRLLGQLDILVSALVTLIAGVFLIEWLTSRWGPRRNRPVAS